MSDVENAQTGATADSAPVEKAQETQQTTAPVENDAQQEEQQARDEKGRFVQKRINELTREKYEARRQVEAMRAEMEQLRAQIQTRQPAPNPQEDPEAYIRHLVREEARGYVETDRAASAQQQEQARFQSLAQQHAERAAKFAADHQDYAEAEDNLVHILGQDPMLAEILMTSDHGPLVVHHLGTHLDEAVQLAGMPPHMRIAHVARLEARLSAPKPKPVTNAPAPVPTVGGGATAPKDLSKLSTADYIAERNRQEFGKRS